MSRSYSHLQTAKNILANYTGNTPLAHEIKRFFSGQKKFGSRDRREIRNLCYCYFRVVRALDSNLSFEEKILQGYFLCTPSTSPFIEDLKPEWVSKMGMSASEKCAFLGIERKQFFPHLEQIDSYIEPISFAISHLVQPDLFLRIRPLQEQKVKSKLDRAQIEYSLINSQSVVLNNATKIDDILLINKEVVIQDYSSQRVGAMLDVVRPHIITPNEKPKVWDCCAASGGKTILAVDHLGSIDLTVSDTRENILHNLKKRVKEAGIIGFTTLQLDLSQIESVENLPEFDLIISDVPCTGSGTWSRTPERLYYFEEKEIEHFSSLQKAITRNIQRQLKPGAFLLYITCSVYERENREVVDNLVHTHGLELIQSEIYSGVECKSDTMFAALLRKPIR
jgi:16S rRNA (cytosine967-C5)-methyltransferase